MIKLSTLLSMTKANAWDIVARMRAEKDKVKFGDKWLTIEDILKQYDPNQHAIHDRTLRPDKYFDVEDAVPDGVGDDYEPGTHIELAKVNRTSVPYQQTIVARANSFLTGNPIEYISDPANTLEEVVVKVVERIMDNNKMDFESQTIGEKYMSETECAELWYIVPDEDPFSAEFSGLEFNSGGLRLRMKLLAKSNGDDLYPVFDEMGDMVAFGRGFSEMTEGNETVEHFQIYMANYIIILSRKNAMDITMEVRLNIIGKIPIMYYKQASPEWLHVQHNITRIEEMLSNLGDTNDYLSDPTTVVKGEVVGMAKKGATGKLLEIGAEAEVSLLEWQNQIKSVEFESGFHKTTVFSGTNTPDISFENMKNLGAFSAIALKMFFIDPHLKVKSKEPVYLKTIQRRINYLKSVVVRMDTRYLSGQAVKIKPKINPYMPDDVDGRIATLAAAVSGGFMSRETAIKLNPLVQDADKEWIRIQADDEKKLGDNLGF